jgi:integrase
MCAVGKPPLRSKAATLEALKRDLGKCRIGHLDRSRLIDFGRARAEAGAGPVTLGIDIGAIKLVLTHAAAVHGLDVSSEPVDLARIALKRLGLIGKGNERDRRPTRRKLERLPRLFDANPRLTIPMTRIMYFAVATAMRLDEICRIAWRDIDPERRMLLVRDRKDPRSKSGNDQRIPLFAATGHDAWAMVKAQAAALGNVCGKVFPYNSRSVGTAFRRACRELQIDDLHFHDLRHEGTSRLFEAGFAIEQVALVTGHKDWKMLRRYTHIRPEMLHSLAAARAPFSTGSIAAEPNWPRSVSFVC